MAQEYNIHIEGIELNQKAVDKAKELRLPIRCINLQQVVQEKSFQYDAICSFQVLEHLSNPYDFIDLSIRLLVPGGKLIISVPNAESFIKLDQRNILNKPPHHITRWSESTFMKLPTLFSLEMPLVRYEPLADYHLDWYLRLLISRSGFTGLAKKLVSGAVLRLIMPVLQISKVYRLIRGHSIYACLIKSN